MRLRKEVIDQLFEAEDAASEPDQSHVFETLYMMVFPQWEQIDKLNGWPECNANTWKYISKKFIEFDRKHHPDVMPGGLWMNAGFSSLDGAHLQDWEVEPCGVVLKPTLAAVVG